MTRHSKRAAARILSEAQRTHPDLDCSLSINAIIARHPSTLPVFSQFGLDTCCGGARSVAEAARAADIDADVLCGALGGAIGR